MSNDQNQTAEAVLSNGGLCMLDDDEADPVRLWAEIHRLRAAMQGPDGYPSWQAAATAERVRRVQAERELAELRYRLAEPPLRTATMTMRERFKAWRERTGFFMDGHDGGV